MAQISGTRDKIIDLAHQLLTQRGPNGFSYKDIAQPLGIRNAAVHYHFPSKADLLLALVEENTEMLRNRTWEFMAYGGEARPQLEGLFDFTRKRCAEGQPVCMVGALSVDYNELPETVKQANQQFMLDSQRWLTRVLETGKAQGEFSFGGDAETRAMTLLATVQGARQLVRVEGPDVLERIFAQVRSDLGIES